MQCQCQTNCDNVRRQSVQRWMDNVCKRRCCPSKCRKWCQRKNVTWNKAFPNCISYKFVVHFVFVCVNKLLDKRYQFRFESTPTKYVWLQRCSAVCVVTNVELNSGVICTIDYESRIVCFCWWHFNCWCAVCTHLTKPNQTKWTF